MPLDKMMKAKRLSDLEVEEVSLVGRGANGRRFLIVKSEDGDGSKTEDPPPPKVEDESASADEDVVKKLTPVIETIVKAAVEQAVAALAKKDESAPSAPAPTEPAPPSPSSGPSDVQKMQEEIDGLKKTVDEQRASIEKFTSRVTDSNAVPDEGRSQTTKSKSLGGWPLDMSAEIAREKSA
jgi:hypothetical protein